MSPFPRLAQVVLDTTDARRLAEFYREFLGFRYRPGDEPARRAPTTSEAVTGSSCSPPTAPAPWPSSRSCG